MKIIHKKDICPQYNFPKWEKALTLGYIFYMNGTFPPFYKILFRFKDYFLVIKIKVYGEEMLK